MRVLPLLFLLAAALPAQNPELRAVWISRDGLTSRQKIVSTLDQLAAARINCVCVNVWSRGFTTHPSDVLLRVAGVAQDPSFAGRDPLQEMLIEAHRRGIEVEAWFEYGFMFAWSGWYPGPTGVGPVLTANPTWIARDQNGNSQVGSGGAGGFWTWAVHEHPDVRRFLLDLVAELVDRYDVDGVQFDRVRYPTTSFGYDPTTVAAYRAATGQFPPSNENQSAWKRWRADGLVAFHAELWQTVKAHRSSVRVTDAPVVWPNAYDLYLQDWPAWLAGGSVDLVYPQVYRTSIGSYVTTLDQQLAAAGAAHRAKVAPGIRAISGTPTADVVQMVQANNARSLAGHVFWYAEGLYDDLPSLAAGPFAAAAPVPGQPPGWRPLPVAREENDPATVLAGSWTGAPWPLASGGTQITTPARLPPDASAAFTLPPSEAGMWRVLAHQTVGATRSRRARHELRHAGGTAVVLVDQRDSASAGWHELGTFWLDPARGPGVVTVRGSTDGEVAADAVALLRSRFASGAMTEYGTLVQSGDPRLSLSGRAVIGGVLHAQVNAAPPGAPTALLIGFQPTSLPLFGRELLVVPALALDATADADGSAGWSFGVPFDPGSRGLPLRLQGFVLDPGASSGLRATLGAVTTVW